MVTRRDLLFILGAGGAWLTFVQRATLLASQVDPHFLRMYEDAQKQRPASLTSVARIAPVEEPGVPLVVRGQLFDREGKRPLPGVTIFAYHTDRAGLYNQPGQPGWRLQGWARTDSEGRFEFDTIRPAPYPDRNAAAHIHVHAEGAGVPRQTLKDVLFEGDPFLTDAQKRDAASAGRFTNICHVVTNNGRESCEILYRLTGEFIF